MAVPDRHLIRESRSEARPSGWVVHHRQVGLAVTIERGPQDMAAWPWVACEIERLAGELSVALRDAWGGKERKVVLGLKDGARAAERERIMLTVLPIGRRNRG